MADNPLHKLGQEHVHDIQEIANGLSSGVQALLEQTVKSSAALMDCSASHVGQLTHIRGLTQFLETQSTNSRQLYEIALEHLRGTTEIGMRMMGVLTKPLGSVAARVPDVVAAATQETENLASKAPKRK